MSIHISFASLADYLKVEENLQDNQTNHTVFALITFN